MLLDLTDVCPLLSKQYTGWIQIQYMLNDFKMFSLHSTQYLHG